MAEHKVQGGNMLLFIDPLGGTDYSTVVCLTSVGTSDSVSVVDASSACGPDKSPGTLEISYSFEGQHLQDPTGGQISGTDLRILLRSEATIGWMISPEVPEIGDEIQSGTGYLSELSSTYAFDSVGTFTGTIQPYGTPDISVYGSSLTVGQAFQGGKIAYLAPGGTSGIIVANQTYDIEWCVNGGSVFGASSTAYGDGLANQNVILAHAIPITSSAAYICDVYANDGYTDWVLPTVDDCTAMYPGLAACGYGTIGCWTSSEFDSDYANAMDNTGSFYGGLKTGTATVIPIRYF